MNLRRLVVLVCFVFLVGTLLWTILGRFASKQETDTQPEYAALFTSGLNEHNRPVDGIEEISIQQERVYLYIAWRNLGKKKYKLKTMIYDGNGKHVFSSPYTFKPTDDGIYNTWCWYDFNKIVDTPGYWRFETYLDGQKIFEKQLRVIAGE